MNAPLLVELLTEELPPRSLQALSAAFAQGIKTGLVKRGLAADSAAATAYATPRRLAVTVDSVAGRAADPARPASQRVPQGQALAVVQIDVPKAASATTAIEALRKVEAIASVRLIELGKL